MMKFAKQLLDSSGTSLGAEGELHTVISTIRERGMDLYERRVA